MTLAKYVFIGLLALSPATLSARSIELDADTSLAYQGDVQSLLFSEQILELSARSQDPAALNAVAQLFRERHPRASVALQNYFERFPRDPAAFDLAGVELLRQQQYQQAKLSFQRAIKLGAETPWNLAKLGMTELFLGNTSRGEDLLEQVIAEDPSNPLARRYLAWLAVQHNNLPKAIDHSEAALRAFGLPKGTVNRAHLDLADMYRQAGRYLDIQVLLRLAVENSDLDMPPVVLAEIYGMYLDASLQLQDVNGARVALTRLRRLGGAESPQYRLSSARVDLIEDKPEAAIAKIEALRQDVPELELDLIPDLARAEAQAGQIEEAVARLSSFATVRGAGRDLPILREAAAILSVRGTPEMMLDFVDTTLLSQPGRLDLKRLGIELLIRGGAQERARAEAEALVAAAPEDAVALRLLGNLMMEDASKDDAVAAFRKAVALNPQDPEAWLTLLGALHGHETYTHGGAETGHEDVEQLLKEAITANPDSAKLRTELGLLYLSDGSLEPAIEAFGGALERFPGYLPALSLAALAQADLGQDLDSAAELAQLARQLAPQDAIARDIEGWIAFKRGDMAQAVTLLDAALALSPEDTTTLYHRAVVAEAQGQKSDARNMFLASLKAGDTYLHYQADARAGLARLEPSGQIEVEVFRIGLEGPAERVGTVSLESMGDAGVRFVAG